jgi:hypothetical protein
METMKDAREYLALLQFNLRTFNLNFQNRKAQSFRMPFYRKKNEYFWLGVFFSIVD